MAIFIPGMKCIICNQAIVQGQEKKSFPPFVSNKYDPIYVFSDAICHLECYCGHPLAEKAQIRFNEFKEKTNPSKRVCSICNQQIINPDDYLGLGHLTDDAMNALYEYNYKQYHSSCLKKWPGLPNLYSLLNQFQESEKWGGAGLKVLLKSINILCE